MCMREDFSPAMTDCFVSEKDAMTKSVLLYGRYKLILFS